MKAEFWSLFGGDIRFMFTLLVGRFRYWRECRAFLRQTKQRADERLHHRETGWYGSFELASNEPGAKRSDGDGS